MAIAILSRAPTNLLSTLDRVKAELSIPDASLDDVLFDMLVRASSAITRECLGGNVGSFGVQTVQETIKGSGSQLLGLSVRPVLSVTQVLSDTDVLDPADKDGGYWIEDSDAGALYRPIGWGQTVASLMWGSDAYASRYILPGGTQTLRYTVTYTAGYFLPAQEEYAFSDKASGNYPLYDSTSGVTLDTAVPPTVPNRPPVLNLPAVMADAPRLPGALEQACLVTVKTWYFDMGRDPFATSVEVADTGTGSVRVVSNNAAAQAGVLPVAALGLIKGYRRIN